MMNNTKRTKIEKCSLGRCSTCPYLKECNDFHSNATNVRHEPILKSCVSLNCTTENVIYLISCRLCNIQYVGETRNSIQRRFTGHRFDIESGKSNQLIHHHFHRGNHGLSNCEIIPIEKIENEDLSHRGLNQEQLKRALTKYRLDREKEWISKLQTAYPLGLNVRIKGIGDFTPSQANYHHFGGRRRRKRSHGHRKPKRLRPSHITTVSFVIARHNVLKNSPTYVHYFKQYLYGLPRKQLENLWNEIR